MPINFRHLDVAAIKRIILKKKLAYLWRNEIFGKDSGIFTKNKK